MGSAAIIFAAAGSAGAQTEDCDAGTCDSADFESADVSNDSGATVVYEDGGSAEASNDEGAVLVHSDDGSTEVFNDSGAVAAWADGGSTSVFNDSGAVVAHSDRAVRRASSSRQPVFHDKPFVHDRVARVTRLPVTGVSLVEVFVMALVMMGIGVILLAAARIVPKFAAAPSG